MTDYTNLIDKVNIPELVKALRHCISDPYGFVECDGCPIFCKGIDCQNDLHNDAAAAIEELQEMLKAVQTNSGINFRMWEEAQAEVERLHDKLCDWCAVCPKERRRPEDCELLSETPVMYGPSEAKMEVQE